MRHLPMMAALMTAAAAAPAPLTLSGTVNAPPSGTVKGTYVIACSPNADGCDESLTATQQLTSSGKSAPFTLKVENDGPYTVLAWQDVNANGALDAGDMWTFLKQPGSGEAWRLKAPASHLVLSLAPQEKSVATLSLSGTVQAPAGVNLKGVMVVACAYEGDRCGDASVTYTIPVSGQTATFKFNSLSAGAYRLIAWKDVNGNGDIDNGDFMARFTDASGAPASLQATRTNITLTVTEVGAPAPVPATAKRVTPTPTVNKGQVGYVTGQVFDALGRPVRGASVTVNPAVSGYFNQGLGAVQTDAKGVFKVRLTSEVSWKAEVAINATWLGVPMCLPGEPLGNGGFFLAGDGAVRHFKIDVNVADLHISQQFVASTNPSERPRYIGDHPVNQFKLTLQPLGPAIDGGPAATYTTVIGTAANGYGGSTALTLLKLPLARYELQLAYVESNGALTPLVVRNTASPNAGFAASATVEFEKIYGCSALSNIEYQFPR
ncbi:hypothetical protein [Deinococcus hopiensis]|uniref:Carboxypeptidase regulatory-like domain-containing protein n=1 Tax=Deinococcus hopiensis KR-140 TaxID=695939 RepID=A0A1W1UYI2_9DEIO|nr:hypothetical protein [Deinococcus hopiensis]SMB86202.1 hypothetical protein SAMN00790413_03727 [Deinococcus hopiensis KR-140]